jgi:hypothetical protein
MAQPVKRPYSLSYDQKTLLLPNITVDAVKGQESILAKY